MVLGLDDAVSGRALAGNVKFNLKMENVSGKKELDENELWMKD
jgi:hypothetical protein